MNGVKIFGLPQLDFSQTSSQLTAYEHENQYAMVSQLNVVTAGVYYEQCPYHRSTVQNN
jgi:hypothetical protein